MDMGDNTISITGDSSGNGPDFAGPIGDLRGGVLALERGVARAGQSGQRRHLRRMHPRLLQRSPAVGTSQ